MEKRINIFEKGQSAMRAMYGLGNYLSKSAVEQPLLNLIYYRVSQINGCAFCLDMHSKDLLAKGEDPQRLFVMNAWRETPFYTERERAALAWAEALTKVTDGDVSDHVYRQVCEQFSDSEVIDLTMAVVTINSYNRINIAFKPLVGAYQPGQYA